MTSSNYWIFCGNVKVPYRELPMDCAVSETAAPGKVVLSFFPIREKITIPMFLVFQQSVSVVNHVSPYPIP